MALPVEAGATHERLPRVHGSAHERVRDSASDPCGQEPVAGRGAAQKFKGAVWEGVRSGTPWCTLLRGAGREALPALHSQDLCSANDAKQRRSGGCCGWARWSQPPAHPPASSSARAHTHTHRRHAGSARAERSARVVHVPEKGEGAPLLPIRFHAAAPAMAIPEASTAITARPPLANLIAPAMRLPSVHAMHAAASASAAFSAVKAWACRCRSCSGVGSAAARRGSSPG